MSREDLLKKLINLSGSVKDITNELDKYGWDPKDKLTLLTSQDVIQILQRYILEVIDNSVVEEWANAIECREDIYFEEKHQNIIKQLIYELANPELTYYLSKDKAKLLCKKLNE